MLKSDKAGAETGFEASHFILVATMFAVLMDALSKELSLSVGTWQATFLRWAFGLAFFIPVIAWSGTKYLVWSKPSVHFWRVCLNLGSSAILFYSLSILPLASVVTIFFAEPLAVAALSAVILQERIDGRQWIAIGMGFLGVIWILHPGTELFQPMAALAVVGAIGFGAVHVITKKHGRDEPTLTLMFWLALLTSLSAAPMAWYHWEPLTSKDLWLAAAVALCGSGYSFFWILGIKRGSAFIAALLSYLSLPIAFVVGWLAFDEMPTMRMITGCAVIILAVYLCSRWRRGNVI